MCVLRGWHLGLLWWFMNKESTCQCRCVFNSLVRKIPWRRFIWASQVAYWWRIQLPIQDIQETLVGSPGCQDALEPDEATCSSILAWKIPWTEESSELQFMELQRDPNEQLSTHTHTHTHLLLTFYLIFFSLPGFHVGYQIIFSSYIALAFF